MKSWFNIYIFIALYCLGMVSCTDDSMTNGDTFDKVVVRLTLSVPGGDSRVGGDYQPGTTEQNPYDNDLDENTTLQRYIQDVYILLFENGTDGKLLDFAKATLNGTQGDVTREIEGQFSQRNGTLDIVVLANLVQNGITPDFENLKGKTEKKVYETLVYSYPEGGWTLGADNRFLPMWGKKSGVALNQREIDITSFNLYRGVAKMGVQVDAACTNFTMKEIYVYYVNSKGYCAAPNQTPSDDVHTQYTFPDVPASSTQLTTPIKYTLTDAQAKSFLEQIYLSESNNKTPGSGKQLKVVVGGVYTGPGLVANDATSYYRIDMEDDKDKDGVLAPFDIIRNHSYIFNITKVENPGTPTPDEALDEAVVGLTVEVEDWTDEYMRGVPDQYTLTTNKSVITYEAYNDKDGQTIDIWTDYSDGWYLEGLDEAESAWLNISANSGEDNLTKTITLTPKTDNNGVTRTASFYVVAGNIKKEITVRQPQPPTANCYVRGNGEYELIVTIKGNGNDGIMPEGADIVPGDGDASITPDKIGIIWETKAGLVKLLDPLGKHVTNTEGQLTLVDYNKTTNSIKYYVDITGATIGGAVGGNALIGAFNAAGEVIWSWHIWVSPDLIDPATQIVKESAVEKWTLNDYDVLDRNLGALENKPINNNSVASMGLLYQWGRKDPFIGAAYSNDNFTGNGLLPVVHYYENWNAVRITDNSTAINTTIAHPTRMIYGGTNNNPTGLSSMAENGGFLWGTNNGLSTTVKDLGSKTIYDPCPVGYRVPPVDAFVFKATENVNVWNKGEFVESFTVSARETVTKSYGYPVYYSTQTNGGNGNPDEDGNITVTNRNYFDSQTYYVYKAITTTENQVLVSSETDNWRINLIYVPHYDSNMSDNNYQWGDDIKPGTSQNSIYIYSGSYVKQANYYGFYLDYQNMKEPKLTTSKGIGYIGNRNTEINYYYEPDANQTITWLPLTGAYDPTKGVTFNGVTIEQGSSITVNSFLWTNSSVNNGGSWIPGAMFLHGTETGGGASGRHIHDLTASDVRAEPHYAGAVRCVRDRAKTKWDENYLAPSVSISYGVDMSINIRSVNADWELIDPGQPWLQVTPDKGSATKGQDFPIKLKLLEDVASGSTATLVFKIANETETRSCVVTVQ